MPAKSPRQYRMFAMVAHDPERAKQLGISQTIAKDFVDKTPASDRSAWSRKKKNGFDSYGNGAK
jgi:hypothetical protein